MISVIMPVYNETFEDLTASINSLLKQTETCFELIIILDNPANEDLDLFLRNYRKKDSRIVYLKNKKNMGIGPTLNKGIENAKYDLIARLDADDISVKDRLEKQYKFLHENTSISMVSTNCLYIDENGEITGKMSTIPETTDAISYLLPFGSTIIHSSVMFRKKDINKLGNYRKLLNCQDYDLWLRMIDSGLNIASIDEPLTKYRVRSDSNTMNNALRSMLSEVYVRNLHFERKKTGLDSFM